MSIFCTISQVNDHLYIAPGRALNYDSLKHLNITCVINATVEIPNLHVRDVEFIRIPVLDTETSNISVHFDKVADKIHSVHLQGGRTVVHCAAGASRSATLCIAYLMKYQHMTLRDAFRYLRSRRKVVHPNNGFFEQLINFERKLNSTATVEMVRVPTISNVECFVPDIYIEENRGFIWLKSLNNVSKGT